MAEIECIHPWTGAVDYRYQTLDDAGIERVLQASAEAAPRWAALPLDDRAAHLCAIAVALRQQKDEIAALIIRDMGKLKRECLGEIEKAASTCEYYAEHAVRYIGDQIIQTEAKRSLVCYQPIGAVFAIMPWNFPIWQVMRFLAPCLMSGNVAVLKHATNVPRCADVLKSVLDAAGVPAGVFGVLHIDNQQAARVIADPRIKAVSLTGSERAGRSVAAVAGQHLKKCVLELGGSDPFVVLADADLDLAVRIGINSRFGNAGQTCIAAKRFVLAPEIADPFVERFVAAASALAIGDPELDATGLAPMARANLRQELHQQVLDSVAAGAQLLIGGIPEAKPTCYPATILDNVHAGTRAYHEELFGPVASILRARDEADAIRIANDTQFGLGASVWTQDRERGEAVARHIDAGAVFVNALVRSDARLPFGGSKTSGYGRELAEHGMREFTNIKTLYID